MNVSGQLPFVLIHGAGGTKAKFRGLEERIGRAHCLTFDLPGHGENAGSRCNTIEEYAEWANEQIAGQDVIVVGHSMGGMVGIEMAARNSDVKGLVLDASHYEMPVHPKILEDLAGGTFPDFLFKASYGKEATPELLEEEQKQLSWVETIVVHDDFRACGEYKGAEIFARLNIPILALYGSEDKLLPKGASEKAKELNDSIQTRTVAGAGHYIMLEKPEEFAQALLEFRESLLAGV
ncbi:alpha/beta fold hydrolase [Aneurinibacillus aneurinilyticus]|jgi:pimeloyl-ACP methyl ester carboxylesterase|uniref:Hydrolase, alpha/beta domain protein n=1 Tax=Aneurinibacillus aneurinilyticus ATCC 12856 TaxID=649747 RepID=U1XYY7_ANEAE|nr:alpha/beta hydrolase [Aneurinibacillus aneurinilyticus]ERI05207.1 hydrolase, alpha/beta domain protein [Aneurinibacillus aneurinilyticus ATCC 12856]MCI1694108.1 alpha/beta hydrolase [Aneurinibacillus aneurinilyticus]MED0708132.1 alpha/beta hydrolase [Aneurinibacillus aneurinilyticus]MED0721515.1 alpha/beta hydrolase [Aneurinibacillus aneurinilyticus]MED0734017.1 alpha/beta hydrolase [Aneurinibacillus aneurinilyticus]